MTVELINSEGNEVPNKTLLIIPDSHISREQVMGLLEPLKGNRKRDWWHSHFYYCLPLTIGNQYGFIVRAESDFTAVWNGGEYNTGTTITYDPPAQSAQNYSSHFGAGIVTIQNNWSYRTPPGINLMVINPPNFFHHGAIHLTAVIETDNLRRDFTFNIKLTEPFVEYHFKKGEPIGAFIAVPRHFVDEFSIAFADEIYTQEQIEQEHITAREFTRQRRNEDVNNNHMVGRRYFKGEDAWGKKFPDHQSFLEK